METLFYRRTRHIWCKRGETSSLPSRKVHLTVAMVQAPEHRALLLSLLSIYIQRGLVPSRQCPSPLSHDLWPFLFHTFSLRPLCLCQEDRVTSEGQKSWPSPGRSDPGALGERRTPHFAVILVPAAEPPHPPTPQLRSCRGCGDGAVVYLDQSLQTRGWAFHQPRGFRGMRGGGG